MTPEEVSAFEKKLERALEEGDLCDLEDLARDLIERARRVEAAAGAERAAVLAYLRAMPAARFTTGESRALVLELLDSISLGRHLEA